MRYNPDAVFSPKAVVYQTIAEFESMRETFESDTGIVNLLETMSAMVPPERVEGSIDAYRKVIRGNNWYFPVSRGRRTPGLLSDWRDVHIEYFNHARRIFLLLSEGGMAALLRPDVYKQTIASETMRGWVGKRSTTGPDALLDSLTAEVEQALDEAGLPTEIIDQVLHLGGLYHGDSLLLSAEEELTVLLSAFSRTFGQELTINNIAEADLATSGRASRLLRDFAKYSLSDFNAKFQVYSRNEAVSDARRDSARAAARQTLDGALRSLPDVYLRARLSSLLSEVRMLNFLNLNLEVKYSFKGWAGVMHGLVFSEVATQGWASGNVYENLRLLEERGQ